jgi:hypothetical protein
MAKQAEEALPVLVEDVSPVSRTGSPILTITAIHSYPPRTVKSPLDLIVLNTCNTLVVLKEYDNHKQFWTKDPMHNPDMYRLRVMRTEK